MLKGPAAPLRQSRTSRDWSGDAASRSQSRVTGVPAGLVRRLLKGKTYSESLGLDLRRPDDWFGWFLAACLFAKPIPAGIAQRTARLLLDSGLRTPRAVRDRTWEGLVTLLDQGGYVRYDFSTATKLLTMADRIHSTESLSALARVPDLHQVTGELTRIPGVGPKTVEIFLRELRGVWRAQPVLSIEARSAAARLGLELDHLHVRARTLNRLESLLVRVWLEHCKPGRWKTCPAGSACGCARSVRGRARGTGRDGSGSRRGEKARR